MLILTLALCLQKARWKVTNKETMSILTEETGASITNKGIFYDKGKEPDYDDPPKLHLLIESNDEARVSRILIVSPQFAHDSANRSKWLFNLSSEFCSMLRSVWHKQSNDSKGQRADIRSKEYEHIRYECSDYAAQTHAWHHGNALLC